MKITPLASGSKGNAYLVDNGAHPLLIECGLPFYSLQMKLWSLDHQLSDIGACLISHQHQDHAKAVPELLQRGVWCYMSRATAEALQVCRHHRYIPADVGRNLRGLTLYSWVIHPFWAVHDVPCLGFYLEAGEEKVVFLTDTMYSPYTFHDLTHIMIACNYDKELLYSKVKAGDIDRAQRRRVLFNHPSLQTVKDFLIANDLDKVQEIWLLHLSDRSSDADRFMREIQELTGKRVYIA